MNSKTFRNQSCSVLEYFEDKSTARSYKT